VLVNLATVQGSDASERYVARLREKGVKVSVGHKAENDGADVVVVSTAIKRDNPELMAYAQRISVVRRAEVLAELMRLKAASRSGAPRQDHDHPMVAALLDGGNLDPTVINGGIISLRHQCAAGSRRLDGGGGRRATARSEIADRCRHRHQCRPRAPRPFQDVQRGTPSAISSRTCRSTALP
jgi:hypothetical protein